MANEEESKGRLHDHHVSQDPVQEMRSQGDESKTERSAMGIAQNKRATISNRVQQETTIMPTPTLTLSHSHENNGHPQATKQSSIQGG